MYSFRVYLILVAMIITGAMRSVGVKLFYQLGFENPLFISLVYLAGQGLSLVVYFISRLLRRRYPQQPDAAYAVLASDEQDVVEVPVNPSSTLEPTVYHNDGINSVKATVDTQASSDDLEMAGIHSILEAPGLVSNMSFMGGLESEDDTTISCAPQHDNILNQVDHDDHDVGDNIEAGIYLVNLSSEGQAIHNGPPDGAVPPLNHSSLQHAHSLSNEKVPSSPLQPQRPGLERQGSQTGLTQASVDAVAWVHSIPWYVKPAIPGILNLITAALRWGSLMYVPASIAEMLMSGLELVLSALAARLIRHRLISSGRWIGVAVVALGLMLVRLAHDLGTGDRKGSASGGISEEDNDAQRQREHLIGAILIVAQCVTAIFQDIVEELFMHETEFPATLLLGMEGCFGLALGIPIYLGLAQHLEESPLNTVDVLLSSSFNMEYVTGLTLVFLATGVFNIVSTSVTSAMTRNMWKNFRTMLVWIMGLFLFYFSGDDDLGEQWINPDSFFILFGFFVMIFGVYIYYKNK